MPSSSTRVAGLLADLARAFSKLGLRWYVFGAQAAIVYGARRLTADVDVTLDLGKTPVAELTKVLKQKGFELQIPDPSFVELTRVIPLVHRRTAMPVDVVLAGPGLEDLFFARAESRKLGGQLVYFASPEDLIAMKVLSGRLKDIEDVETLLSVREADLRLPLIRETLGTAQQLLDQSDLLPAFERLLRHKPGRNRPPAPKRAQKPPTTKARSARRKKR